MPEEQTSFSEREKVWIEQVAHERGITFEEACEQLAKEALAARVRRGTGRAPARVYDLNSRRKH
jgi:hypothetical protein